MDDSPQNRDASRPSPRHALTVLAFAVAGFIALTIFGLGMATLATNEAVIAEPGLTQIPGVVATALATLGFAAVTGPALLRGWAGIGSGAMAGIAAALGYVAGVFVGVASTSDPALAASVAGRIATSWFALAVALAGLLAGVGAAVAVRAGPNPPRWPWERPDQE